MVSGMVVNSYESTARGDKNEEGEKLEQVCVWNALDCRVEKVRTEGIHRNLADARHGLVALKFGVPQALVARAGIGLEVDHTVRVPSDADHGI